MASDIGKNHLMAKARGFTISIGKMTEAQRRDQPNGSYGEDYNRLLDASRVKYPTLSELLPPPVYIHSSAAGTNFTEQSYGEIDTYCEQICQLLGTVD